MARARGELTDEQRDGLAAVTSRRDDAVTEYRAYLVGLLASGCSFSEVSRESGVAASTLQIWKREAND